MDSAPPRQVDVTRTRELCTGVVTDALRALLAQFEQCLAEPLSCLPTAVRGDQEQFAAPLLRTVAKFVAPIRRLLSLT